LRKLERVQLAIGLRRTLDRLPPRERRVIEAMYYEGKELREVAVEFGISPPWACRLHRRAVDRLRRLLRESGLAT
jgi:RNA polymerase sigma factor for flagellar operon FliA